MKDLILDAIERIRTHENNFSKTTMRWSQWCVTSTGECKYVSKKERKQQKAIHLSDTTRNGLTTLTDENLLNLFSLIIRIQSKQM